MTTVVLPGLALVALAVPMLVLYTALPDPMAVHWNRGGADGSFPRAGFYLLILGLWVLLWIDLANRLTPISLRWFPMIHYAGFGALCAVTVSILVANTRATGWRDAGGDSLWIALFLVLGGALGAWLGRWLRSTEGTATSDDELPNA